METVAERVLIAEEVRRKCDLSITASRSNDWLETDLWDGSAFALDATDFAARAFFMSNNWLPDSEWMAFIAKLEVAEEEFAGGRPAAFKALWSYAYDVTLCGAFSRVECGWENVAARLDWASSKYSDGTRIRKEVGGTVGADFAYIVQTELIRSRLVGRTEYSSQELRLTMGFRREADGW